MSNTPSDNSVLDWQRRDLDALAELHATEDPRSIAEMIADDQVDEYTVEKAVKGGDGWEVHFDGGLVGFFTTDEPIKEGDTIGLYTGGRGAFGSVRHGFSVNGEVRQWKTPWERYADRIAMLAQHDRQKRERTEKDRAQVSEWVEDLRGPYRARIERFMQKPTFILEGGTYETYPVLMAQRIEAWVREQHGDIEHDLTWDEAVALVKELESKPYVEQAKVLHAGKKDKYGISVHQADSAFGMAAAVLCGKGI